MKDNIMRVPDDHRNKNLSEEKENISEKKEKSVFLGLNE